MKKTLVLLTVILILMPMNIFAQSYNNLWKQVEQAKEKDLPQQELQALQKIIDKARGGHDYGQLLKAQLLQLQTQASVSPDSLQPAVERLVEQTEQLGDVTLQAVSYAVLGMLYRENYSLDDHHERIAADYFSKALAQPALLARAKVSDYKPLVVSDVDGRIYNDDLLNIVCREAGRFDVLHEYYLTTSNRRAQFFSGLDLLRQQREDHISEEPLNKSQYLHRLDSLIERYGDLKECGEAAIERVDYMEDNTDATTEQVWQYINTALDRWGGWKRMNELRDKQRTLSALQFNASLTKCVALPDRGQTVSLNSLRGVREVTMTVYKADIKGNSELDADNYNDYLQLKPLLTPLPELTQTRYYVGKQPYDLYSDSIALPPLKAGIYLLEFNSEPATNVSHHLLYVSDVRAMVLPLPRDTKNRFSRIVAVNATTGQPLPGATIQLIDKERERQSDGTYITKKNVRTLTADAKGECIATDMKSNTEVYVATESDPYCPPQLSLYGSYDDYDADPFREILTIFTDRAIYRPGQTVHVAAILYRNKDGLDNQVLADLNMIVSLRDANYKEVAQQVLTTDEYGTGTIDFVLPSSGLTGRFCIQSGRTHHYFSVEEYKRPTFELEFPVVNQSYEDGDTVVVRPTARSYAGVPVQGAKVTWKVLRRRAFWWCSYNSYWQQGYFGSSSEDEEVASGESVTEADGTFAAEIPMVLPQTRYPMFYNFLLHAKVTDQAGETHEGEMSLPLGNRRTALSCDLPDKILAENPKPVTFHLYNAAGIDVSSTVRYQIDGGEWLEAPTNTPIDLPQLASGRHTLKAVNPEATANAGDEDDDNVERQFVVFSLDDTRLPIETADWFYQSASQFPNDGTPVTVQVGASGDNVHIVYAIFSGSKQLESGFVDKTDELINGKFQYEEDYNNGLLLTYAWMRDGKMYRHSTTILRPVPDKRLTLQWATFRDRLTPGQQEQWTLTVRQPDGQPAPAQLMATLYDKSLDQLMPHSMTLRPYRYLPLPSTQWRAVEWKVLSFRGYKRQDYLDSYDLEYSHFDEDLFQSRYSRLGYYMGAALGAAINTRASAIGDPTGSAILLDEAVAVEEDSDGLAEVEAVVVTQEDESAESPEAAPSVRENLEETAFFMPQLVADATGTVTLTFTLPESLTTWRFLGLAHTTDMMVGTLEGESVARKDVMIQPNMPRFLRVGDRATVSARVINTGEQAVQGKARLVLLNPETQAVVAEAVRNVTVEGGTTTSVTFPCQPADEWPSLLVAKVTIAGQTFSDGEQHYLPILPNSEHVTVSVPFNQNEPGTKTIDLTTLFPSDLRPQTSDLRPQTSKLTVEYTNNPAWLLIQALPTVAHAYDDCAVCQATALYANSIGRHILRQNPTAKNVFEAWSREQGSETSLMSNLQKNQELRELVLSETPWVADAERESDQKHRLGDFFNEGLINQRISSSVQKLQQLQRADGSWSWWIDMPGSFYMTTEITELLVRLNVMTTEQSATESMLSRAFDFLGQETVDLVKEMKKAEREGHPQSFPSHKVLQWLYLCTIDGRQLPHDVQQANSYLIELLKKETHHQSIYDKALTAIVLSDKTYVQSLKEYTVYREEMGRYYDTPRAGYSWRDYRIPTQVVAIEAIRRLTPQDTVTIQEMQRWLLQQKRTQSWDTPINAADAIYAFLNDRSAVLAPQPATVLSLDATPLETSDATAGVGYVKTAMPYTGQRTFTAQKTSTGTSWGAVYAQFMQHTSDIADQQESGIRVKREILTAEATPSLIPQPSALQVGSRVRVRITIEADRNYDFVQVIDKRAACMEPVRQLSGYSWQWGCYCTPRDNSTCFYFDQLSKGRHVIETDYYVDREGTYETGTCTVECAYAPEFRGKAHSLTLDVK